MANSDDTHGQRYSEDEKRQILKYLETHTYKETVAKFGISEPTLARWRQSLTKQVDNTKAKIIITIPQYWLNYLNERIKERRWENYDEALLFLLKDYDNRRKANTLEGVDTTFTLTMDRLKTQFTEFLNTNPEIEAILVYGEDKIQYQSTKWPKADIKPLISWWKHLYRRIAKGETSVEFNGGKYIPLKSFDDQLVLTKKPAQSGSDQKGDTSESASKCNTDNYICGVRMLVNNHHWYFIELVNGKPPCHVMTAHMNFHRLIYNLMPVSEADIIKPFTERDQLTRKTKTIATQKPGNGKKTEDLEEILEERQHIPVPEIEKLVIEKLEAKIGQPIPFHEYEAKMPDICFYAVLGHVTKLRIRKANLTSIPDLIKELNHLEILDLQHNHIALVPESIGNLLQLEELNLSYNDLQFLPNIFHNLKKLSHLYLGHNKFQEFPIVICKSRNLKELEIANNQISILPPKIREMENLQTLDITNNLIQMLDRDSVYYGRAVISWKKDMKADSNLKEG